jgi:hypothetical protein
MNAFQAEVGRDEGFMPRRQPQNGSVIPDSSQDAPMPRKPGNAANAVNQRFFPEWHGATNIRIPRDKNPE